MRRATVAELQSQLIVLKNQKNKLEQQNIVKQMLAFNSLPVAEKKKRREAWDAYYEAVRETRAYQRFWEQRGAFKRGDTETVKRLAIEAGEQREKGQFMPKPSFADPIAFFYDTKCRKYCELMKKIEEIQKELMGRGAIEVSPEEIFSSEEPL